ncbi:hypothetical protein R1flu_027131 [Riccia fluitans]|uniref:Uncharacterized protein n=1 Tax=Riccia fluitans TaxID=41844 RepID=A0ABD1XHW6_9MARC
MYCLNMLKYVTSVQRQCVLEDIFFWGISNTNAEGDRLLVKNTRGGTNIIGWNKIAVIFGVKQNEKEDFRSIKVMHTTLDKYDPRSYLPALIETNPNKKLVSGQPYKEILYYKDAAPYGPTYHLMTRVAELFWLRHNLFVGTPLEEAKGWVGWTHVEKDTDMSLAQLHSKFPKLITSLSDLRQRCKLPEEIPIASPEQPVSTRRPLAKDKQPEEISIASSKQPVSSKRPRVEDMERGLPSTKKNKPLCVQQNEGQNSGVRTRFTQPSCPNIPTGVTMPQPVQSLGERSESTHTPSGAILVEDLNGTSNKDSSAKPPNVSISLPTPPPITTIRHSAATETWKKAYEDQLSKVRELQETNDGLRGQVVAKDAEKSTVHALARTEVQRELEELKRSVTELEDFKRSVPAKEKAAKEIHVQKLALVQTQLEEYKRSSEASIKRLEEEASRLREALAEKESAVQALENAHQKEISTLKATCRKYKTSLDGKIGTNADLQAQVLNL